MRKSLKDSKAFKVSIVIVSFNTAPLLRECLSSIYKDSGSNFWEVIVVDNGSSDGSVELVKREFPRVHLMENGSNLGFSRAENQGLRFSHGDFVFFLNSDTKMLKETVAILVSYLNSHPDVGLVAPGLINTDGSAQPSCFHFPGVIRTIKAYWLGEMRMVQKYLPASDKPVSVDAVVGAAMMLPGVIAKELGGFDEKFFFYFEDIDLCRRVREKGLAVVYCPMARVVHHHGASGKPENSFGFLKESMLYPLKKISGKWEHSSTQSYLVESSIQYFGWIRHLIMTLIIKFSPK